MSRKADEYVIGVLFTYVDHTEIKFVTSEDNFKNVCYWEDGKEAKAFSKEHAKDTAYCLCMNGFVAVPMLKADYLTLSNAEKKEEK